jgi:hypothetical protein
MSGTSSPSMAAADLMFGGLAVSSTSTPSLDGTYAVAGQLQAALQAEINAVALNGSFADGSATLDWPDIEKVLHAFDVTQFRALAAALANFVVLCTLYGMGISTTAPTNSATIP